MNRARAMRPVQTLAAMLLAGCFLIADDDPMAPEAAPLRITTSSLPLPAVGIPYSAGIDAEGGDGEYHWDLESGALPPGLSLSVEDLTDDDVVITGIPEEGGDFTFVLRVRSEDDQVRTRQFTLTVVMDPTGVSIRTLALAPGLVGASYDVRLDALSAVGGSVTWSVQSGTLPEGLVLEPGGRLHGTPAAPDTAALLIRAATDSAEATRSYVLQVVADRPGTYDITVAPVVPIPAAFVAVVDAAVARWEAAITGDLAPRPIPTGTFEGAQCGGFGTVVNGTSTDDLIVLVNIAPIDGRGQTLGFAGPCLIRTPSDLPIVGVLTLDAVDLGFLSMQAQIDLVTHEIGHVLGFGSLWQTFGLITESTDDPRYTGSAGVAQWAALGGAGQVPVEDEGGEGTARSHWRERVFGRELMTGFSNTNVFQPMSRVTIASFADMGYAVNLNAADSFTPAPPMSAAEMQRAIARGADLDDVYAGVVGAIDAHGRMTPLEQEEP